MISANTTLATGTTVATTPTPTEKSIEATEQSVGVIVAVAFGSSMLTFVMGVAICLLRRYICSKVLLYSFVFLRCQKEKNMAKVDVNRDYNLYFTPEGERLDEGVCEAVDTNDYYGQ